MTDDNKTENQNTAVKATGRAKAKTKPATTRKTATQKTVTKTDNTKNPSQRATAKKPKTASPEAKSPEVKNSGAKNSGAKSSGTRKTGTKKQTTAKPSVKKALTKKATGRSATTENTEAKQAAAEKTQASKPTSSIKLKAGSFGAQQTRAESAATINKILNRDKSAIKIDTASTETPSMTKDANTQATTDSKDPHKSAHTNANTAVHAAGISKLPTGYDENRLTMPEENVLLKEGPLTADSSGAPVSNTAANTDANADKHVHTDISENTSPEAGPDNPDKTAQSASDETTIKSQGFNPSIIIEDIAAAMMLLTRIPIPWRKVSDKAPNLSRSTWAYPIVGLMIGLIGVAVFSAAAYLNLPPTLCALLTILAMIFTTGAFHEDGLADMADGIGGGMTKDRKLEIMRDSRVGTYGATALILSVLIRAETLASFSWVMAATTILIAAALSRAMIVLALYLLPPAREQGLGTVAGAPPRPAMLIALITGIIPLLLLWSPIGMGLALLAAFIGLILVSRIAMKAVDGYTGDILGAIQQVSETTIMITLLIVSQHIL